MAERYEVGVVEASELKAASCFVAESGFGAAESSFDSPADLFVEFFVERVFFCFFFREFSLGFYLWLEPALSYSAAIVFS